MFSFTKWRLARSCCTYICRYKSSKPTNKLNSKVKTLVKKSFGQPTYQTHPHLIGKNEVIPLISASEICERRHKLVQLILAHSHKNDLDNRKHVIVIPSASKQYMSDKIPYVFRQNSDFLYLTGCQEPDTCLIITTTGSSSEHDSILFMREQDAHSELWDGPRTSCVDATNLFGVSNALPYQEFDSFMRSFLHSKEQIVLWYDFQNPTQNAVTKALNFFMDNSFSKSWDTPRSFIHNLRVIKSPAEISLMAKSCEIASGAIRNCMKMSAPGISEHQLFAKVDYDCRMAGAEILAYPPVVAGGERGTIIHYINNNQLVNDDELILMDAGCEYHGYSSDITRTWPINGNFTPPQRELYEAVLSVQQDLISTLKSRPTLDKLLSTMYVLLGNRLQEVGVIPKTSTEDTKIKAAYQFCPHHVSHYLGMDVHDTATVSRNIPVQPGMIITVEPGIYITSNANVPEEFRGVGIRIEDDILITEKEPIILTANCPKSVSDVENSCDDQ